MAKKSAFLAWNLSSMLAYLLFLVYPRCGLLCFSAGGLESCVLVAVNIGKMSTIFQPKARVPSNKNQNFLKIFNCFVDIEL